MSSVRMCDHCGAIFSENEENWSTGMGTQFYTDENGIRRQREKQEDRCGTCNGTPQVVQPRIPLEGGRVIDPSRIATLERENGIDP